MRAAPEQARLPMQDRNHRRIGFLPRLQQHPRDVYAFAVVVLGQRNQAVNTFEIKSARIIRLQSRRQVLNEHRLISVYQLPQQSARQERQSITMRKGIDLLGEARRPRDAIKWRLLVAPRE